jgi:primosomal protein N' (replication factor Y)
VSLVGILNADNLVNNPDFRASERAYQLIVQAAGRSGRSGNGRGDLAGASPPDLSLRSVSSDSGELCYAESYSDGNKGDGVEAGGGLRGGGTSAEVVVQTVSPESRLIGLAAAGEFREMARELLTERAAYGYPPYSRLVSVVLRHADREVLEAAAGRFGEILREMFSAAGAADIDLLGPVPPATERVKGEYALLFLLKVPRGGKGIDRQNGVSLPMSEVRETLRAATQMLLTDRTFRAVSIEPNVDPQ